MDLGMLRSNCTPTPKAYEGNLPINQRKSPEFIHQSSVVNLKSMQVSWDVTPEGARESLTEREQRQLGRRNTEHRPRHYSREYPKIISSKSPIEILSAAKTPRNMNLTVSIDESFNSTEQDSVSASFVQNSVVLNSKEIKTSLEHPVTNSSLIISKLRQKLGECDFENMPFLQDNEFLRAFIAPLK